jgi:hypothetical protein
MSDLRNLLSYPKSASSFGRVFIQQISPEKCHATGKGLEVAQPGERAAAVLHVIDLRGKSCSTPVETLTCELVSERKHVCV